MPTDVKKIKSSARHRSYQIMKKILEAVGGDLDNVDRSQGTPTFIVVGLPGSGKTTALLYLALFRLTKTIVSFSRRKQRDWWFEKIPEVLNLKVRRIISDDMYEVETKNGKVITIVRFKAKYEFPTCPLSKKDFDTFLDYIIECKLMAQTRRCIENCPYKQQFSIIGNLLRSKRCAVILATHVGGMILDMVFEGAMHIMIDEFDEYVLSISQLAVPEKAIQKYMNLADPVVKKIVESIVHEWVYHPAQKKYYPPLIPIHAKIAIVSTATFHPYWVSFYRGTRPIGMYHVNPVYEEKDIILYVDRMITTLEWWGRKRQLLEELRGVVSAGYRRGLNIGIIAPRKDIAKIICDGLSDIGYVYCEEVPDPRKQWITVLVPGDRLYRGISLEADMVVTYYQGWNMNKVLMEHHPWMQHAWRPKEEALKDPLIRSMYIKDISVDPDIVIPAVEAMNKAYNVQALFRFIRNHRRRHIIVALDGRMVLALKYFFEKSYMQHVHLIKIEKIEELVEAVESAVRLVEPNRK